MGLTVFVGRKIGAGLRQEAGKIIGSGIWMFGLIAVVFTVIMVFAASLLAQVMHAPEEAFKQTVSYIAICSAGAVFIVAYNLVGSIFRGIGDSKIPLVTVAIATVFAQAMSVLLSKLNPFFYKDFILYSQIICGMEEARIRRLEHIGRDSWDRPVYRDDEGILWKDVDPSVGRRP